MIEVSGPDGRVHTFAEGTSDAQIDAAMRALYPDVDGPAPPLPEPAPQARAWAPPPAAEPRGPGNVQIIVGALVAAVVVLLVVVAFMLGRSGPDAAQTAILDGSRQPRQDDGSVQNPAPPAPSADVFAGFVTTREGGNVTVRAQPSQSGQRLASLPHGAPVSVTGAVTMPDGLWRKVDVGGAEGYVRGDFISQTQPPAIAPPPPAPAPVMEPRNLWGIAVTRTGSNVNVRRSPSTNAAVIAYIPYGAQVWIVGQQGNWYLVEGNGVRGWASTDYVRVR
jgi:uncharacterized protein YraI